MTMVKFFKWNVSYMHNILPSHHLTKLKPCSHCANYGLHNWQYGLSYRQYGLHNRQCGLCNWQYRLRNRQYELLNPQYKVVVTNPGK